MKVIYIGPSPPGNWCLELMMMMMTMMTTAMMMMIYVGITFVILFFLFYQSLFIIFLFLYTYQNTFKETAKSSFSRGFPGVNNFVVSMLYCCIVFLCL